MDQSFVQFNKGMSDGWIYLKKWAGVLKYVIGLHFIKWIEGAQHTFIEDIT